MITLSASGGSVTFTFSGNSTYLNDGTITVPVNSLALIIDESDMATFRKAASNDIFVSANIAEFGMTKAELESWYKTNMVGATGGGSGSGVTPSEVQTMIDESISGKADSSDVYTTGQTSGATEIANALNAKLDATAYTPTDLSEYWTSAQTSSAIDEAVSGKANQSDFTAYTASTDAALSGKVETNTYTAYTANTQSVLNSKLDATAYTPVQVSSAITENDTNAVAGGAVYDKVHVTSGNGSTTLLTFAEPTGPSPWYLTSNYPSGVTKFNIELNLTSNWSGELYWVDESNTKYFGLLTNSGGSLSFSAYTGGSYNSFTAVTSQTDDVFAIEITGLSGGATSGLTAFGVRDTIIDRVVNAYAVEGETVEYWIKEYVDAKVAEAGGCEVSSAITSGDTNPVQGGTLYNELRISDGAETETTLAFEGGYSTNYPNGCTKIKVEVVDSMNNSVIYFYNGGGNVGNITINNYGSISVDATVFQSATYEISGTTVIISYPTVQNVTEIRVEGTINYVYKAVTTGAPTALKTQVAANTTALGGLKLQQISQGDYESLQTKDSSTLYIII